MTFKYLFGFKVYILLLEILVYLKKILLEKSFKYIIYIKKSYIIWLFLIIYLLLLVFYKYLVIFLIFYYIIKTILFKKLVNIKTNK